MKAFTLLVVPAILTLTSCRKENMRPLTNNQIDTNQSSRMSHSNPYDLAGELHNQYLDVISLQPQFPKHSREELFQTVSELVAKDFPHTTLPSFKDMEGIFNYNLRQSCIQMRAAGIITDKQEQSLLQLAQILESQNSSKHVIITRIEALEKNTLSRSDMPEQDKTLILGSAATARHSIEYWNEAYNNSSNRWFNVLNDDSQEPAGLPKWVKIAAADVGGFLVGGASSTAIINDGNFHFDFGLAVIGAAVASGAAAEAL